MVVFHLLRIKLHSNKDKLDMPLLVSIRFDSLVVGYGHRHDDCDDDGDGYDCDDDDDGHD